MAMSANARKAFQELEALGVPVYDWGEEDGYGSHVAFVMIWADDLSVEIFADYNQDHIKEKVENERVINPFGFRQDVHEIFAKYDLVTDWDNRGQVLVFNDSDAPGLRHSADYVTRPKTAPTQ